MNDSVKVLTNARSVLRRFDRLPKDVQSNVRKGFVRGLLLLEEEVKRRADLKFSGSRSGLASRLTSYVDVGDGMDVDGVIGFRRTRGFPYELAQEEGAQAKPGGAMTVPVSDEARGASARGQGPRDLDVELFVPPGTHVLAETMGGGTLQVHYVLIKRLKPRLHFRDTVEDNADIVAREVVKESKR